MVVGNHTLPSEFLQSCSDGTFSCISQWAEQVTMGWFWVLALAGFGIVLFMATSGIFGDKRGFGYSGLALMLGAVWLSTMSLISWWIASVFIVVGIISFAVMIMSGR